MGCSYRVAGETVCRNQNSVVDTRLEPGLQIATLTRPTHQELFITAVPTPGQSASDLFCGVVAELDAVGARPVSLEIFGLPAMPTLPALMAAFGGELPFPVTWLEEGWDAPNPRIGVQTWAVTDLALEPIRMDGRVMGNLFEDGCVRVCRLGGLGNGALDLDRPRQARLVFERMAELLRLAGMSFANVARTWFYNHRMLEWYGEFNKVRTTYFHENGVFDRLVPASTGVGGANAMGSALTAGLLAIEPQCDAVSVFSVPSPLQCPALEYGSSFSRAVEIALPDHRRLLISGTASIAPEGHTVHVGDVDRQLELTMEVVKAILESRQMAWTDVSRAIGYFKTLNEVSAWNRYADSHGLPEFPILLVKEDICRDDLLFEIELDAVKAV